MRFLRRLGSLRTHDDAATATEYAVMLAMLIVAAIGAITIYGGSLSAVFVDVNTKLFTA